MLYCSEALKDKNERESLKTAWTHRRPTDVTFRRIDNFEVKSIFKGR